jgi:hypothetical protein
MPFVSVTRLRVRSAWYLPAFFLWSMRSARQAKRSPGNLATGLLAEAHRTFWTRTAWTDESAMRAFLLAMPHKGAMRKLADWCDEASVVHWTQDSAQLPDWNEAHRRMVAEGRPSTVRHPSPAHQRVAIPAPVLRRRH